MAAAVASSSTAQPPATAAAPGVGSGANIPGSSGSSSSLTNAHTDERLVVAVRIRPLADSGGEPGCVQVLSHRTLQFDEGIRSKPKKYNYDYVFSERSSQEEVYQTTTAPLVQDVLNGYNAAVFAYGATGSGKTHTMLGPNPKRATFDSQQPGFPSSSASGSGSSGPLRSADNGLMIKAVEDIFKFIEDSKSPDKFKISLSYLEIYNELIRDLLNPGGPLELREDNKGNQSVAGLSEISTPSRQEVIQLLMKGNKARTVEPTAANQTSSRSHALLSITVQNQTPIGTKQGRLFLTDLAGSERARKTKNRGKRLQEGAHINRSLLALGNCINALAGGARYVNYRDSKLTRLLKEALSGRCKTVMIAHVAPEAKHRDETKNTLVYADRANHITTRLQNPTILEENRDLPLTHYQTLVSELRDEVGRLKAKMLSDRPRSGVALHRNEPSNPIEDQQKKMELKYLREQIVQTFKQQMRLRRRLLEADSHLLGLELDAERQHMVISHWQSRQGKLYDRMEEDDESDSEGNSALRSAWNELSAIEKEVKRYKEIRITTEHDLEECRKKGVELEDELPERITSDEERELLSLLCRVHELEADKVSLQAERLARQAELRRRDLQLLRAERQRRLCEDIISTQRRIIEEGKVELPEDLRELYALYQQEIHASTYTSGLYSRGGYYESSKLPPIYNQEPGINSPGSSSSASSEWSPSSPLPPIDSEGNVAANVDRLMGPPVGPRLPSISRLRTSSYRSSATQSTSSDD
ncbi:kinesin-like protein KIF19 [Uranotaenia lowii]|uniref:kinesin-like protein KIF19 n=1 Tax=Uranotaenia lowii TaxID=190385 RepID=UPI002478E443|nr:kinesin-like protein KIF19 [Uranotaenia lowii]XP_055586965.1 kinesin-like protein KIF19 [Uranotaenia lowii]XP_055586966.1 kinesin-like protein KIF19 [Uranotaenia lowii]XP_055586967.1 kinesin-like protein KIF19 [Uranotaenia lowii]XP_055586968.1 kinesin-like protein KIF19 [Uranotaenia lowii]